MEFAAQLSADLKFHNRTLKYLLKKALTRIFPESLLNRPKMGFGVPIGDWFRKDLRSLTNEMLLGSRARNRGYFDIQYIERILKQHLEGKQNHHHRLWALLMFEAWARTFLDRDDPLQGPVSFT
jgi:asparagine synthase (glutamine-hydrolysing)